MAYTTNTKWIRYESEEHPFDSLTFIEDLRNPPNKTKEYLVSVKPDGTIIYQDIIESS